MLLLQLVVGKSVSVPIYAPLLSTNPKGRTVIQIDPDVSVLFRQ